MLNILYVLILVNWTFAFHPITLRSRMLVSHVYRSLQDCDWLNCIQACHDDPHCISYNFIRSTRGLGVCEMIDCGLEDLFDIKSQMVFSHRALFQQLTSPGGREICESSSNTQVGKEDFSLLFPVMGADSNFVQKRGMSHLPQLSVCFWLKASPRNHMTIFSYLGTKGTKELMILIDRRQAELTLGGESRAIPVAISDGNWHHICTTWDTADGSWAFFKDGVAVNNGNSFKAGYVIPSGGSLVLGQEQITEQTFEPRPFIGELGNFNIWSDVVSAMEVLQMSKSCLNGKGSVFNWTAFRLGINGKVEIVKPSQCTP